ncbi:MAG: hypothetical protein ACR2LC_17900 [Pyrinomonadaceae bacterium]
MNKKSANRIALMVFAPVLILTGIAGFLIPADKGLTSGAMPYNVFHIVFGCLGIALWLSKDEWLAINFNIGFGLIDLYQALAHIFFQRDCFTGRRPMIFCMSLSGWR